MSTSRALYSSASLKAANAQPYSSMQGRLDPVLLAALQDVMGFEFMTPVQSKVLSALPTLQSDWYVFPNHPPHPPHPPPAKLESVQNPSPAYPAFDSLVQAKTGTGKTTAFLLPAMQTLLTHSPAKGQVSILILSPTRELALQIAAEATQLLSKMRRPLEVHTAFGGTGRATNLEKFMNGDPKIVVATPGRLNDYLGEMETRARFTSMQTLILDEADAMLEAGKRQSSAIVHHSRNSKLTLNQVSFPTSFAYCMLFRQKTQRNGRACASLPLFPPRSNRSFRMSSSRTTRLSQLLMPRSPRHSPEYLSIL